MPNQNEWTRYQTVLTKASIDKSTHLNVPRELHERTIFALAVRACPRREISAKLQNIHLFIIRQTCELCHCIAFIRPGLHLLLPSYLRVLSANRPAAAPTEAVLPSNCW